MKPLIVGVCGRARSGKDAAIEAIADAVPGVMVAEWAGLLKLTVQGLGGLTREEVDGVGYDREQPEPRLGGRSVRHALQHIGTAVRDLDPDAWVRVTMRAVREGIEARDGVRLVLISGTRWPNEAAACDRLWWVERPDAAPVRAHASEHALGAADCQMVIRNVGTLAELQRVAVTLARREIEDHKQAEEERLSLEAAVWASEHFGIEP